MNIELHIEKVQSLLDQMDLQKKCKFSAWCCNALLLEIIKENMTKITNSNENYRIISFDSKYVTRYTTKII